MPGISTILSDIILLDRVQYEILGSRVVDLFWYLLIKGGGVIDLNMGLDLGL